MNKLRLGFLASAICLLLPSMLSAQVSEDFVSDRFIQVAGAGELADSISVWGDVGSPGRYLVPFETNLAELISYSNGFTIQQGSNNNSAIWSKTQIRVKVSRFNQSMGTVEVASFKYKPRNPEPTELFEFDLQNNDIVTLEVRRRPTVIDYINVVAPVVGLVATSVLLIDNLR